MRLVSRTSTRVWGPPLICASEDDTVGAVARLIVRIPSAYERRCELGVGDVHRFAERDGDVELFAMGVELVGPWTRKFHVEDTIALSRREGTVRSSASSGKSPAADQLTVSRFLLPDGSTASSLVPSTPGLRSTSASA